MPVKPPKIDPRSHADIVRQTESLVEKYTGGQWRRQAGDRLDAGGALIRIFARFAELIIDRLNQVPEKNFLAFLDMIGTEVLPPQPARVPLTFEPAAGSPVDAVVPARTQVAAQGGDGEVVFETEQDLVVSAAELVSVFVHEPDSDRYGDYTEKARRGGEFYPAFSGDPSLEHSLYLAHDALFRLPAPKRLTLTIEADSKESAGQLKDDLQWSYPDGESDWKEPKTNPPQPSDGKLTIIIDDFPVPAPRRINALEAAWLRAALKPGSGAIGATIRKIVIKLEAGKKGEKADEPWGLIPEFGFANGLPIDLNKGFYPFGERPVLNDTLYLSIPSAFGVASATGTVMLTVQVRLSEPKPVPQEGLKIAWETWNGQRWEKYDKDNTQLFTQGGEASFDVSGKKIAPVAVNGESGYWIRARIVAGHFGTGARYVSDKKVKVGDVEFPVYELKEATYQPPLVESLRTRYVYDGPLAACVACNGFDYEDRTKEAGLGQSAFQPFTRKADKPTLYLGFNRAFRPNQPIALYAQLEPPKPGSLSQDRYRESRAKPVQIKWQYSSTAGEWSSLNARDETKGFSESGLIRFFSPPDFAGRSEFGHRDLYWLRAQWEGGVFALDPCPTLRLLTNTVWASQAVTVENEILGSSSGDPGQSFRTSSAPVLRSPEPGLEVREPDLPSASERQRIESEEGKDSVTERAGPEGQPEEIWICWHRVPDFYGSGPRDRHYVLDYLSGVVRFGDGRHGMVPPVGRGNLRMSRYRVGGGARGNQAAGTITQLKTTVPYVAGVTNPEAAGGGADQESLERVQERGPTVLRHRRRAATAQDFEDLAYEASPLVARARAITSDVAAFDLSKQLIFPLELSGRGEIKVTAAWRDTTLSEGRLKIRIYGPGKGEPYGQRSNEAGSTELVCSANKANENKETWYVTVTNAGGRLSDSVTLTITFPDDKTILPLKKRHNVPVLPDKEEESVKIRSGIKYAGKVNIIILPQSLEPQPTPSHNLIRRVESYLVSRCGPGIMLEVTGAKWVEVAVTAEIAALSSRDLHSIEARAIAELDRFLHPLTGGRDHRGWPFGRKPRLSDLYSLLQSIEGIDHVDIKNVDPETNVDKDALIFSGRHNITVLGRFDAGDGS